MGALGLVALLVPEPAFAHGLVGKLDLPVPKWLFAWAAALVLIISFVALATLWPTPRLERPPRTRVLWRQPRGLEPLCGAIGVALFAVVVYAGTRRRAVRRVLEPHADIHLLPVLGRRRVSQPRLRRRVSAVQPVARVRARRCLARGPRPRGRPGLPEPLPYPAWLGRWPAAVGILGFAWLELVYVDRGGPATLA